MSGSAVSSIGNRFAGHALLVSNDLTAIGQITGAMQQFAFTVDVCSNLIPAARLISRRKFQAIVLDIALQEQLSNALEVIHYSLSNQNSVTFAIIGSGVRMESRIRPSFVMQRPLTDGLIASTLKAAMGLIIRDYRRYFRCPVRGQASIQVTGGPYISCELMNISEGGLAVETSVPLHAGAEVKARFMLPDTSGAFRVDAEVCWSDNRCRAGLRFRSLSPEQTGKLQSWLSDKIEQGFPEPVLRLFHK
jgi:hypothetical protein